MSLLKQLLISVSLAISVILAGTLWFGFDGARNYLNERLHTDAANAASSLALSLSQPAYQDAVTRELLMTALFDSGQYRRISFSAPNGEVVLLLEQGVSAARAQVPAWFDSWLPIVAPTVSRAVSDGWKQVGEVAVTPEDVYARESLWNMTWKVLLLFIAAGVLWALFAFVLIRWLKRALKTEISEQVRAIAEGSSAAAVGEGNTGARIKELAQVHHVIQSVRERVRATADEQNRQIETLQVELHSDEVTAAVNRKYFINELRRTLETTGKRGDGPASHGHVLIFRQRDLAAINALHDRQQADIWLRSVSEAVKDVLKAAAVTDKPAPQLARLNGSDFVVLLAGYDGPDTADLINSLRRALANLRIRTADERLCRWSYALTDYAPGCDVAAVLARLDHGLMRAENAGHDEVEYMASSDYRSLALGSGVGETAWKALIQDALHEGRLRLSVERADYRDDDLQGRHEGLLAMRERGEDGQDISGYLFMPPAVRLGLSGACDLRAIELALDWLHDNDGHLAVRVSLASLLLPDFLANMERILLPQAGAAQQRLSRLAIEIDAHGLMAYPDEVDAFCTLASRSGVGIGLRRLGEHPAALLRLHKVRLQYIKLGGDLIAGLLESPGAMQLVAAITEVAIGQGVKVYAHDVPNAPTAALLLEYGVLLPQATDLQSPMEQEVDGEFVDD